MVINKYPRSDENTSLFQKSLYYTFLYGTVSFVLVLVALFLLYVTCSKKYRLNWFEKDLLERTNKVNSRCSRDEYLNIDGESEGGNNKSTNNLIIENKWTPLGQAKNHGNSDDKPKSSGGAKESMSVVLPGKTSPVNSSGEESTEKELQPIARSDKQVVFCTTKPVRPRVSSMNRKLDHTKIDSSLYQEVSRTPSIKDIRGSIYVSMLYDSAAGILFVRLIQAKELFPRDFSGTSDPYAKIRLLPDSKNVWQTRIHKKTTNPVFDEDFVFEVPSSSLNRRTLEIILYDFDAYSRHLSLGKVRIALSDFKLSEKITVSKNLEPCLEKHESTELGEILVTLSFLQSAERLTVVVNKVRNLRVVDLARMSSDPFVKISLIQGGKRVKKKKISVQRNTTNPVFNESMTFNVSKENLSEMSIEFCVYHETKLGSDEFLGKVLVGSGSSCHAEEVKFFEELLSGKTAVSRWLTLNDSR